MSRKYFTSMGLGTAAAAALIGVGTAASAFAVPPTSTDADPFSDLFGACPATGTCDPSSIGGHDAALDTSLFQQNPMEATAFDTNVDEFESTADHPFTNLVNLFDPTAFTTQTDPDVLTSTGTELPYLVAAQGPQFQFADSVIALDYFLTGTGATFLLSPAVDGLAGFFSLF